MGALLDTTLGERDSDRTLGWGRWCISAEAGWTAGETVDNAQEANILGERRRADTLVVAVVGLVGEKYFAGFVVVVAGDRNQTNIGPHQKEFHPSHDSLLVTSDTVLPIPFLP